MRLFNCSPLWAVNKVAQKVYRNTTWKPLLIPALFWFGMSSGTNNCLQHFRDTVLRLARPTSYSSPSVVMSRRKEALALWSQEGSGVHSGWGDGYRAGSEWDAPQQLGTLEGGAGEAQAALNTSGAATLLWVEAQKDSRRLMAASYLPGEGWSPPTLLDDTGLPLRVQVLIDEEGNSLATWHRFDSTDQSYHFLCARRTSRGWGAPLIIGDHQLMPTGCISGNGSGFAAAMWNAASGSPSGAGMVHNTWVRLFDPRHGWGGAVALGRDIVQEEFLDGETVQTVAGHHAPLVAVDGTGRVLSLWQEVSAPGCDYQLKAARYDPGEGWGHPEQLATNPVGVSAALSDEGMAFVCLAQAANWPDVDAYLSSLTIATDMGLGWFSEKVLDNYPYFCLSPTLVLAQDGQPLVTWVKGSGEERELWGALRTVSGWSSAFRVDAEGMVEEYEAGWDAGGNVIVVWTEKKGADWSVWGRTVRA